MDSSSSGIKSRRINRSNLVKPLQKKLLPKDRRNQGTHTRAKRSASTFNSVPVIYKRQKRLYSSSQSTTKVINKMDSSSGIKSRRINRSNLVKPLQKKLLPKARRNQGTNSRAKRSASNFNSVPVIYKRQKRLYSSSQSTTKVINKMDSSSSGIKSRRINRSNLVKPLQKKLLPKARRNQGTNTRAKRSASIFNSVPVIYKRQKRLYSSSQSTTKGSSEVDHIHLYQLPDEVLLEIFSYLLEKDLCRLSQVCKRLHVICNDTELWKPLYQNVYEYDHPLFNPAPLKFEFVESVNSEYENPWRESFKQLYHGVHVRPSYTNRYKNSEHFKGRNIKHFNTYRAAFRFTRTWKNPLIFMHTGVYRELFAIEKNMSIIGAASGNVAKNVTIITEPNHPVIVTKGSRETYLGHLTFKGFSNRPCLMIIENCSPIIEHCIVRNNYSSGRGIIVAGKYANPNIRHCDISACKGGGLLIFEYAQGTYEENELSLNGALNVVINDSANPIVRRNHIHHGEGYAITINRSNGVYEENEINHHCGVSLVVSGSADPIVRRNHIHHTQGVGVVITRSEGIFEENKISMSSNANVMIMNRANPVMRRNLIEFGRNAGLTIKNSTGTYENNDVIRNGKTNVLVLNHANPVMTRNVLCFGSRFGIIIQDSDGLYVKNIVVGNPEENIHVEGLSDPNIR